MNVGVRLHSPPDEVFILIRICNVRTEPEVVFLVDPWQMHMDGVLSLTSESLYLATFMEMPPVIRINGSPSKLSRARFSHLRNRSSSSQKDVSGHPNYSYKPLRFGEIRLLQLFPGTGDMPIQGTIYHTPLKAAHIFSALSYVWGPPLQPFELRTSTGAVLLTTALYSALSRIRHKDTTILLWVDAVCINQADEHEKIIQIRLLREIFQSAEVVFAWIGDEKENSNRAIEALVQVRTLAVAPDDWPQQLPPVSPTWVGGIPPPTDDVWLDIGRLFQRDWFQRVWVVQELVLASQVKIFCGSWEVNGDDIFSALKDCLTGMQFIWPPEPHLRNIPAQIRPAHTLGQTRHAFLHSTSPRKFEILTLFDMFSHCVATKERDKLFGLLGLASDVADEAFDPDYSSSLESVVRRYACEFIGRGAAMHLLYRAGISKAYTFCSWIPNWTGEDQSRTISNWYGVSGMFSAGTKLHGTYSSPVVKSEKLLVAGFVVDKIVDCLYATTAEKDIISVVSIIHTYLDKVKLYPTGESSNDLKLKVPIGDAMMPCSDSIGLFDGEPNLKESDENFSWKEEFQAIHSVNEMVGFLQKPQETRERGWKYWTTAAAFAKRLSNGRFCTTKKRYVGIAPPQAEPGDLICVLNGGAVPFVLRRTDLTDGLYTFIGECYVHGIMYGEALSFDGIKEETFSLA